VSVSRIRRSAGASPCPNTSRTAVPPGFSGPPPGDIPEVRQAARIGCPTSTSETPSPARRTSRPWTTRSGSTGLCTTRSTSSAPRRAPVRLVDRRLEGGEAGGARRDRTADRRVPELVPEPLVGRVRHVEQAGESETCAVGRLVDPVARLRVGAVTEFGVEAGDAQDALGHDAPHLEGRPPRASPRAAAARGTRARTLSATAVNRTRGRGSGGRAPRDEQVTAWDPAEKLRDAEVKPVVCSTRRGS
jgi:hypothetical protein